MRPRLLPVLYAANVLVAIASIAGLYVVRQKASLPISIVQRSDRLISEDDRAFVSKGDTIASLDDVPLRTETELDFILERHQPEDRIPIVFTHQGKNARQEIVLTSSYTFLNLIVRGFAGMIYLIFGFILLVKRPNERTARVVNITALAAAVLVFDTWGYYATPWIGLFYRSLFSVSYLLVPVLLLHFGLIFPRQLTRKDPALLLRPFYGFAILYALLLCWTFARAAISRDITAFDTFDFYFTISEWIFGAVSLTAFGCFIVSYRRSPDISDRKKIRWVLVGVSFSVLFYFFFEELPQMLGTSLLLSVRSFMVSEDIILLSSTIAPVTFTIAIVRYHILDIDNLINRATGYLAVGAVVFAVYAGLLVAATAFIGRMLQAGSLLSSSIAAILTAMLFEPIRVRVQRAVDKTFFRVRYNYREAQKRILDALAHAITAREAAHTLADQTATLLGVEWALVAIGTVPNKMDDAVILLESSGMIPESLSSAAILASAELIPTGAPNLIELGAHFEPFALPAWVAGGEGCPALIVALSSKESDRAVGALALGPKRSGQRFTIEDVDLAESVARQAALAIERSLLMERLLEEQAEATRQKQLSELKSVFVSSVSHDLKTPLTSIKLFVQLLEQNRSGDGSSPETLEYLRIIDGESDRLKTLIDNVLDHARIERGVMEYHFATVDLNECLTRCVHSLKYLMTMQGFAWSVELCADPLPIGGDATILHTVLTNVLSNAIKYSGEEKRITIRSFKARDPLKGEWSASAQIADRGLGIDASDLDHIFEPYFRSSNASKGLQAAGTGLGLANVKHAVDAHRGKIAIESAPGAGTSVILRFPLVE